MFLIRRTLTESRVVTVDVRQSRAFDVQIQISKQRRADRDVRGTQLLTQ